MRIHRGLLFWGLFLIPLGVIPLLARANVIDLGAIGQAWRFWPLILVAIGLALLLGRSRASILATVVLALVLGSVAGATLAAGPGWIASAVDCGEERNADNQVDRTGTFTEPATVKLDLRCGSIDLTSGSGADWSVKASYSRVAPEVNGSGSSLEVGVPGNTNGQRQTWNVVLPAEQTNALEVAANAGAARLHLEGAKLARLEADMNAGDLLIDGGAASIAELDVRVNAGRARITLDNAIAVTGELHINAGALDLCLPADAELSIRMNDQLTFANNLGQRELTRSGDTWRRAGTSGAAIDLVVEGNAANLTLDPAGGCR